MSFATYGNWCGAGWSAGQYKNAADLTEEDKQVEAVDALDQACKEHDIGIAEGDPQANKKFYEKASAAGWYGLTFAQFVKIGGPPLQNYLRGGEDVNAMLRTRREKQRQIRERVKRKQEGDQRDEHPKRVLAENEDDDLEAGLAFVGGLDDQEEEEEEKENENVVEALLDMQDDPFITPQRSAPRVAPTLTREDRVIRGNEERSLTNLLDQVDNNMADQDIEMAPQSSRSGESNQGSVNRTGNRETLVKYNSRTEMGIFTETRTAYLPLTVYFSINRTDMRLPVPLHIRVDWPVNIFSRNTLAAQELNVAWNEGKVRAKGLSNDMTRHGIRQTAVTGVTGSASTYNILGASSRDPAINQGQLYPFPTTVIGSTAAVQGGAAVEGKSSSGTIADTRARPAYRAWYAKMYEYAHCMETDWKVTYFSGDSNEEFQNLRVYEGMDCQSVGNTDTIPTDVELGTIDHWPYLKKHNLVQRTEARARQDYVISGKWYPGMQHPMKMVPNEEDIKTWTKLDTDDFLDRNPTAYREDVTLLHYSHPDSNNQAAFMNVRVDLRYKIQFKDLSKHIRWPRVNGTTISLTNMDCVQVPYPSQTTGVDPANPERVFASGVTNVR